MMLQEKLKKLRDDWNLLKNRGDREQECAATSVTPVQQRGKSLVQSNDLFINYMLIMKFACLFYD